MSDAPAPLGAPLPMFQSPQRSVRGAPLPMVEPTETPARAEASAELRRVAEEFEAVFLSEMLSPMFEALDTEGLGGGGMGERIFRPMLVQRYAEAIAQAGGVGVADAVMQEMLRLQTVQTAPGGDDGADR